MMNISINFNDFLNNNSHEINSKLSSLKDQLDVPGRAYQRLKNVKVITNLSFEIIFSLIKKEKTN